MELLVGHAILYVLRLLLNGDTLGRLKYLGSTAKIKFVYIAIITEVSSAAEASFIITLCLQEFLAF